MLVFYEIISVLRVLVPSSYRFPPAAKGQKGNIPFYLLKLIVQGCPPVTISG